MHATNRQNSEQATSPLPPATPKKHVSINGDDVANKFSLEHAFSRLWISRCDVYAVQQSEGGYSKVEEPLTTEIVQRHLRGEITVGVYQLDKENTVKWLCWDLDPEKLDDPLSTAKKIIQECVSKPNPKTSRFYKKALLFEASRYPDPSYHIWVFFEPLPVPAKAARWLALKILEHANVNPKLVEVFPKQTELTKHTPYGNLVKAPLGFHRVARKWSRFLNFETLKPLPHSCILNVQGVSFSETDLTAIEGFEDKRHVQIKLELPKHYRPLKSKEEERIAHFLAKYWKRGWRNRLELAFLGWTVKRGVAYTSARRIVKQVTELTSDEEANARLQLVDYHYKNRLNMAWQFLGVSGLKQVVREALA